MGNGSKTSDVFEFNFRAPDEFTASTNVWRVTVDVEPEYRNKVYDVTSSKLNLSREDTLKRVLLAMLDSLGRGML